MADRGEALRVKFREERISAPQAWIMCAQARFENLAAFADRFETPALAHSGNCLAANRKALVCTRKALSIQFGFGAIDKPLRRPGIGILANSLPLRMRKIPASAPIETRGASDEHAARFRHWYLLLAQPFRKFACPIGNDDVRASALERSHNFKHGGLLVQQPFLDSAFDHRVLTADVVNRGGFSKAPVNAP